MCLCEAMDRILSRMDHRRQEDQKERKSIKKKKYENFVDLNYDQFQLKANIEASQWNPTHNFCSC